MNRPVESSKQQEHGSTPGALALAVRILLPLLLLIGGILGFTWLAKKPENSAPFRGERKAVQTRVRELSKEDYRILIPAQGVVRAHSQVNITSQVAGRILKIRPTFEDGAFFKEGDVLLELDPTDFQLAVISAKSQVAQAELNLAQEKLRAAQAELDWKDLGYEGEPNEFVLRIPQVRLADRQLEQANAQLATAERSLERSKIRAPFSGRVLRRSAGIGQTVGGSTPLGEIFATDYSEARLAVSTRFLQDVSLPEDESHPPLAINLRDALADQSGIAWDATILRTEGALDSSTLELFAIARIEDPFGLQSDKTPLRIGQPVVADIPGHLLEDVFVIPREAISNLDRIRLVDPDTMTLGSATLEPLWSDEEHVVFRDSSIPDGTLLVLNRLVFAPDGGKVEIIDESVPLEPTAATAPISRGVGVE